MLFSMTKSFASLAIGIAWDHGLLQLSDPIITYFPQYVSQKRGDYLDKITIRDLLTMSAGAEGEGYQEMVTSANWVESFFKQQFCYEPGTRFLYSTPCSHLLSAIITAVTGESMAEFLDQHLFHPLGINTPQWEQTADGLTCGGMGLSLPPLALLKIGELLLNQGTYQGKSMISAEYVKAATSGQIVKPSSRPYSGNRYGYQFHVSRHGFFRLDGAFGQVCLIYPEQQMVLVVLSQQTQTERLLELVEHYLVAQQPFLGEREQPQVLHELATLSSADFIDKLVGQIVQMEPNSLTEGFALAKTNRGIKLHLIRRTNETLIECCPNEWTQGKAWFIKDTREYLQRYKCWATLDENKLEMTVYWIETPYITRISISLGISELIFDFKINVSFTLGSFCEHIKMEG